MIDVSGFTIDLTAFYTVAGVIFTAMGGIWVVRKILGLIS